MTTKKKNTGTSSKPEPEKSAKVSATQKVLNVVNTHRAGIYQKKLDSFNYHNKKGFIGEEDRTFLKGLKNMYKIPYTEASILDKKGFNFGEGCIVFNDGQKYTVKKQDGSFVVV